MNHAILCLGSNVAAAHANVRRAMACLQDSMSVVAESDEYVANSNYLNKVVDIETSLDYDMLKSLTKDIERNIGRCPEHKAQGIVPIDIDVVLFNHAVMRPNDFAAPYFTQGYLSIKKALEQAPADGEASHYD